MSLKLMYITNSQDIARIAEKSGVDIIFVDLEIKGKSDRQRGKDTVISGHKIEDVKKIKGILCASELLVRVNPLNDGSEEEIDKVIGYGADIVMLPFFKTAKEVESFIKLVNCRAKTCLLFETSGAVDTVEEILSLNGIDYIHIGLNDLHICYNMKFLFQLLADGTVEKLCSKFRDKGIPYGFGGIAGLGQGKLSAEFVIAEHYRLGSSMVILSRSFCNAGLVKDSSEVEKLFETGVESIREYESALAGKEAQFFENNRKEVVRKVDEITSNM
ncbi:MAG TPA: aldolase/citrate lyase family protein [bacterium]|nr:aldolase/citrate lyase family protein [bacterium]